MTDLATRFKALADPVRLRMLEFLRDPDSRCCAQEDGVCACDFETVLGVSQPTVSHHMKILVQAELVRAEKRGRWMYYELNPAAFEELTEALQRYQRQLELAR